MKKQVLSVIMTLVMLVSVIPTAAEPIETESLEIPYLVLTDGSLMTSFYYYGDTFIMEQTRNSNSIYYHSNQPFDGATREFTDPHDNNTAYAFSRGSMVTMSYANSERTAIELINAFRKNHGLGALNECRKLREVARSHSLDMVTRNYMEHTCPDGVTFSARARAFGYSGFANAENIAGAYNPVNVVSMWVRSAGHRDNLLNRSSNDIGVGTYGYTTMKLGQSSVCSACRERPCVCEYSPRVACPDCEALGCWGNCVQCRSCRDSERCCTVCLAVCIDKKLEKHKE